jgi:hypothetical protein
LSPKDSSRISVLHGSLLLLILAGGARIGRAQTIRVDITPDHVRNTFRPTETFGAGVDRIPLAATDKIFTEPMIKQILSAGWQTVTYRQNNQPMEIHTSPPPTCWTPVKDGSRRNDELQAMLGFSLANSKHALCCFVRCAASMAR